MDLDAFNSLMSGFRRKELGQDPREWRCFLEFVSAYFANRGVARPLVVEIGVWNGLQRRFYEQLLGAEYIGIDNLRPFAPVTVPGCSVPDIAGDSHDSATVEKLKARLAGRMADLLFVDGDHAYESVQADYQLYAPMARRLVAFHDIFGHAGVAQFWGELVAGERERPFVIFKSDSSADWILQMGIGILVKE